MAFESINSNNYLKSETDPSRNNNQVAEFENCLGVGEGEENKK